MVVGASYDNTTKEVVLTLQNGTTTRFSVADLVDGLVSQSALTTILSSYYTKTEVDNLLANVQGNEICIGDISDVTEDTKLLIETDTLETLGTEVVNTLTGDEQNRAPSAHAVNQALGNIIESGSNANGNYIKYADGTLIQYNYFRVTDQAINSQYGDTALYSGNRSITFPVSFIDANYSVTCGFFRWGTSLSWGNALPNTKDTCLLVGYDYYPRATGTITNLSYMAIGKWK